MSLRLLLTNMVRPKAEPILKEVKHPADSPPMSSGRMFPEAARLLIVSTGIASRTEFLPRCRLRPSGAAKRTLFLI